MDFVSNLILLSNSVRVSVGGVLGAILGVVLVMVLTIAIILIAVAVYYYVYWLVFTFLIWLCGASGTLFGMGLAKGCAFIATGLSLSKVTLTGVQRTTTDK